MLGSAIFRVMQTRARCEMLATTRNAAGFLLENPASEIRIVNGVDAANTQSLVDLLSDFQPDDVINCIGIVKQLQSGNQLRTAIPVNAIFPQRLEQICSNLGARLIHISTDCVFSGSRGMYREDDVADTEEVYGVSKLLGEVTASPSITIRTSFIGHEHGTKNGLLDWFLNQETSVKGFRNAFFSGLTTHELAHIIHDHIIPNRALTGLYHVAGDRISKHDLLLLIREAYGKEITVTPDTEVNIDRSLDGSKFREATGYQAPDWITLTRQLRETQEHYSP